VNEQIKMFAGRVGVGRAAAAFGVNPRTYRHRRQSADGRARPPRVRTHRDRRAHPAALTLAERVEVLAVLCEARFADLAPAQVYATLLDEGRYLCSERQMYRVLAEKDLNRERRRGGHQRAGSYGVPRLSASGPNECWTWDITKLRGPAKGVFFFVYSIIDIYSRCLVGWTIAERETESIATQLIATAYRRHNINKDQLTIHADRGSPMIAGTVAELLTTLGVVKSHSRPRVSNDNPYIEAHFKTLKYRPDYPDRFESITQARTWMRRFTHWYNHVHYHSAIAYLHPADLHTTNHTPILEARQTTLDQAYNAHPERFTKHPTTKKAPTQAWINKPTIQSA
jgi:putative transposase